MANQTHNSDLRFFSNSSLLKNTNPENVAKTEDPTPFGFSFKEEIPNNNPAPSEGICFAQSPTNTPSGSDTCLDIDYEF